MSEKDLSIWSFVNSKIPTQKAHVVGLQTAIFLAARLSQEERHYWMVKNKEWDKAKKVVDCPELFPTYSADTVVPDDEAEEQPENKSQQPSVAKGPSAEVADGNGVRTIHLPLPFSDNISLKKVTDTSSSSKVSKSAKSQIQRRKNLRASARLAVSIHRNSESFETVTKNISVGGILVQASLYQFHRLGPCRIIIGSPDNKFFVEFQGEVVDTTSTGSRIVFSGQQDGLSLEQMTAWVQQYIYLESHHLK